MPHRWRWALVLAWAAFIWALSDIPDLRSPFAQDFLLRKIAHTLEFALLAGLLQWALWPAQKTGPAATRGTLPRYFVRTGLVAASIAIAYAAIDELHQGFVLGRTASARDVLIDSLGVIVGISLGWLLARRALLFSNLRKNISHN